MNLEHSDLRFRATWIVTVAALALGVFLRFFRLDWQGLWVDEIHTLGPALHASSLGDALQNFILLAPTPPLYYVFMMGWTSVVGFAEYAVRLPSAVLGSATVVVFWYGIARVFPSRIAHTATILMALSWPAIYYSQEVRGYSAVLFFTTWSFVHWVGILHDRETPRSSDWWGMAIASALASMTHPFGFVIAAFQQLYLFAIAVGSRQFVLRPLVCGAFLLALYLTWMVPNVAAMSWLLERPNMFDRPGMGFFVDIGAFLFHHPIPALLTCVIPLGLGFRGYSARLVAALKQRDWRDPSVYLPLMMAVPFGTVFAAAQVQPFLYSRYLIVFLPIIFLFYSIVLDSFRWKRGTTQVFVMFLLGLSACYWIFRDYYEVEKPQTREMARYVAERLAPDTGLVTGCEPGPPFDCSVNPGSRTDADWSKYLYYLNYRKLPILDIVPDVFHTMKDLDNIIENYTSSDIKNIFIMGSRAGTGYVETAVRHLDSRNVPCTKLYFHAAVVAECTLTNVPPSR